MILKLAMFLVSGCIHCHNYDFCGTTEDATLSINKIHKNSELN